MDIEALRARALETKKRKRTRPDAAQSGASATPVVVTLDDLEEGEIDDDGPPAPASANVPFTSLSTAYRAGTAAAPSLVSAPGNTTGLPPSLDAATAATATAVKEQSKRVIAELLSYGVPPAYLVSIGVSRQLLAVAFNELGLHLALPALPPSPSALPTPAVAPTSATLGAPHSPLTLTADAKLADLEAQKRQELLARKAALLARNQQSAQSLESELESLFSAGPIGSHHAPDLEDGPEVDPVEAAAAAALAKRKKKQQLKWARKKRKLDAAAEPFDPAGSGDVGGNLFSSLQDGRAQAIHDLRESLDHTEELVDVPPEGPFASTSSGTGTSSLSAASTSRFLEPSSGNAPRRPTATEFEHDPTVRLSTNSLMKGRRGRAFIADEPVRMVIDISDTEDEGDDDDDDRDGQRESSNERTTAATSSMTGTAASTRAPTLASSRRSPPEPNRSRQGSPSNGTDKLAAETARRQQLEEKENAIKRMMERIAEIERRKKDGSKERGTASTSMSRTPSVSNGTAPPPPIPMATVPSSEPAAPAPGAPVAQSAIETVKVLS
ncbi:hypothetical protein BMF94_1914 [Rhodotorula taiwanensis]|uniref:Uncharacterized protein n=1 Tax=Rhodotorula taiwanensis TaxID=741276 RepID=A0A2S5BDV0_9BASI|nr:hypothetical protein BMF94_1914 [Rhodotorula taiwanensis]